jgi:ribosomal protein S18 acetylase RimI-like enzyme
MMFTIRAAAVTDVPAIRALLPRLADFPLPAHRDPKDLWESDAVLLERWAADQLRDVFVHVAEGFDGRVLGATITTMRPEPLSRVPSAHLEVLVVDALAAGRGVGRALVEAMEREARTRGATALTLHVFANNARARALYEHAGFEGELLRYIKPLPAS